MLQAAVNLLRLAKSNKAHTLHALAGSVLERIVTAAGKCSEQRILCARRFGESDLSLSRTPESFYVFNSNARSLITHYFLNPTGDDVSCKLALVSAFTQYGGANFDTLTGTQTISSLLAGFSYEAVIAHAHVLVGVVAAFPGASSAKSAKARRGDSEGSDEEDRDEDSSDAGTWLMLDVIVMWYRRSFSA
jgi:ribosomal protein L12E/L44/L45/RPP1/RPP2